MPAAATATPRVAEPSPGASSETLASVPLMELLDALAEAVEEYADLKARSADAQDTAEQAVGLPSFNSYLAGAQQLATEFLNTHVLLLNLLDHVDARTLGGLTGDPAFDEQEERDALAGVRAKLGEGATAVYLTRLPTMDADVAAETFTRAVAISKAGVNPNDASELVLRVAHVGEQLLVGDVPLVSAVAIKRLLERAGVGARIREERRAGEEGRKAIPESVRHEVWRRDAGCCVDCGSRERLEFDHIIPLSQGGSSTARNLELRCENCNRRKGARI